MASWAKKTLRWQDQRQAKLDQLKKFVNWKSYILGYLTLVYSKNAKPHIISKKSTNNNSKITNSYKLFKVQSKEYCSKYPHQISLLGIIYLIKISEINHTALKLNK